jgi:hypothetical protein
MRLAVVSDTHVPTRAAAVPEWVIDELRAADHVVHAGDFDSVAALETVREAAGGGFTGVRGNVDPGSVDLPAVARLERGGVTFVVTHGAGSRRGYHERVARTVRETAGPDAVGISGHTHEYHDAEVEGVRLLNPGSATGARPATAATMMTVEVADGRLSVERLDG